VVGCCEYDDEPLGSGATELVTVQCGVVSIGYPLLHHLQCPVFG
jgi:hypothetical protein